MKIKRFDTLHESSNENVDQELRTEISKTDNICNNLIEMISDKDRYDEIDLDEDDTLQELFDTLESVTELITQWQEDKGLI